MRKFIGTGTTGSRRIWIGKRRLGKVESYDEDDVTMRTKFETERNYN